MDINELVKESLRQIVEGVKEVRHEIGTKAQTAPKGGSLRQSLGMTYPDR